MPEQNQQLFVLDRDTMMRLWLTDQVVANKLTQHDADNLWRRYSTESRFVANYFSVTDDVHLLLKLARDLRSPLGRVYFKTYKGKAHIIFKGNARLRAVLTGTRYGVQNAKVIGLGLGRSGVRASARGGTILTIFLLTAWDIADYFLRDDATLGQLLGAIASDVTKAAIGGGIGAAAGALAVGTVVGTFALGPLIVAVAVGIGVGLALDWLDNRYQLTAKLQKMLDDGIIKLQGTIERQRQGLISRGAEALDVLAHGLVDLAIDYAIDQARRLMPLVWRSVPQLL